MTLSKSKPKSSLDVIATSDDSVSGPVRVAVTGERGLFADILIEALIGSGMSAWWSSGDSTSEVFDQLSEHPADLVLLNLDSTGAPELTIDLIGDLEDDQLPVIVLGPGDEPDGLYRYLASGALAVVDKSNTDFHELAEAIRITAEGDRRALREWQLKTSRELRLAEAQLRRRRAPFDRLTKREAEVLQLLCQGYTADDIADHTYVSLATVRSHVRSILLKLDVHSQLAAAAKAYDTGWYQTRGRTHQHRPIGPTATSPTPDTPTRPTRTP